MQFERVPGWSGQGRATLKREKRLGLWALAHGAVERVTPPQRVSSHAGFVGRAQRLKAKLQLKAKHRPHKMVMKKMPDGGALAGTCRTRR